jgi:hypothetical protein
MHRQPPSLHQSTVVDRTVDSESVIYVRLNDNIDSSQGDIKLNNNNQQQLTSYKLQGLVEAAMSLAQEEGFLPAFSNAPYTTNQQVRLWIYVPSLLIMNTFIPESSSSLTDVIFRSLSIVVLLYLTVSVRRPCYRPTFL